MEVRRARQGRELQLVKAPGGARLRAARLRSGPGARGGVAPSLLRMTLTSGQQALQPLSEVPPAISIVPFVEDSCGKALVA